MGVLGNYQRLLKNGSRLVISDGFQIKPKLSKKEKKLLQGVLVGWVLPYSELQQEFKSHLSQIGFKNIQYYDKKEAVKKASWYIHRKAKLFYPFTLLFSKLKIIPQIWHHHTIAGYNFKLCMDRGIITYGIFVAEK